MYSFIYSLTTTMILMFKTLEKSPPYPKSLEGKVNHLKTCILHISAIILGRRFWNNSGDIPSLKPEKNHLKMNGWKTIVSFLGFGLLSGNYVSFREGKTTRNLNLNTPKLKYSYSSLGETWKIMMLLQGRPLPVVNGVSLTTVSRVISPQLPIDKAIIGIITPLITCRSLPCRQIMFYSVFYEDTNKRSYENLT